MKCEAWLEFGGIEVANISRITSYLNAGLLTGVALASAECECDATDEGPYVSPAADGAPWYDSTRPESGEFLGLLAHEIRLDPVAVRSVGPKLSGGSTIGSVYFRHRILSVHGIMLASSAQGMAYGDRWLADVLAGTIRGCAPDTARILLACPSGSGSSQFRTLRRVGIVDGPTPGPAEAMPECHLQEVLFQFAAGVPWLLMDEQECLTSVGYDGGS